MHRSVFVQRKRADDVVGRARAPVNNSSIEVIRFLQPRISIVVTSDTGYIRSNGL